MKTNPPLTGMEYWTLHFKRWKISDSRYLSPEL